MKRCVALLLLMLTLVVRLSAQEEVNGRVGWSDKLPTLKGDVRSVIISEYSANELLGKVVKGDLLRKIHYSFDAHGNVAERIVQEDYSENGIVYSETASNRKVGRCDEQGNVVEEIIYGRSLPQRDGDGAEMTNVEVNDNAAIWVVGDTLQGQVAGADVMTADGESESFTSIRVRGSRSIVAGDAPLVVVDGVVDAVSSINDINPSEIKSMTILKDPTAIAAYGSRGANGVILVTTHSGSCAAQGGAMEPKAVVRYKILYR